MTVDQTGTIRVWEFATGKLIRTFTGHHGETSAHFSPDSRYIVGSSGDAPIYIWDVYGTKAKTPFDGESLWKTLADQNAEKAFMAVRELIASPKEALALLKAKLPPDLLDQKVIDQHLIDLGSPRFAVREKASAALLKIGESIEPQLKKALQTTTDEEVRQRLTAILEALNAPSSEKLRTLRALDALEHLGTPEARQYLEILSKGSPPGLRTQLAKEALERLAGQ